MKLAELTTVELDALDRRVPVVLNIAAIEQHGPHLPLATDAMVGAHLLERLEALIGGDVLILPQLAYGCSSHHMDFSGTISLSHETMARVVVDVIDSIYTHGFRKLVLLNSHGGNEGIGRVVLEHWGARHADARIFLLTWWRVAGEALRTIQESGLGGVGHACEFETSLLMHFAPEAVRADLIVPPKLEATFPWAEADMLNAPCGQLYRSMKQMTCGTGVAGDPTAASAAKGKRISVLVSERLRDMLRDIHALELPNPQRYPNPQR